MTDSYPHFHRLGQGSAVALAALVLRLADESIKQEQSAASRESLDGVRRGLRKLVRRGSKDSASSDTPLSIESPDGFRNALKKVPSEVQALKVVVEAAAYEPWLSDEVIAERRRKPIDRDLKESVLADACRSLSCPASASQYTLDEIFPGRIKQVRGLPTKDKLKIGSIVIGAAAVTAYTGALAAPTIGAAIGGISGLSGAAASSAGLAFLGGGSLAAGGLGMAGGTMVVSSLAGAGGGGIAAFAAMDGVNIDAERKKLEVLLALCCNSSDEATRAAGLEIQMAFENSICFLLSKRISMASEGVRSFAGIDQRINEETAWLNDVAPDTYNFPLRASR